jgi:hypothetical protein
MPASRAALWPPTIGISMRLTFVSTEIVGRDDSRAAE